MGERERESGEKGEYVGTLVDQFGSLNDQLNHLPHVDLKNLNHLAWSEFCLHYVYSERKTSPVTLTVFLIKPFILRGFKWLKVPYWFENQED